MVTVFAIVFVMHHAEVLELPGLNLEMPNREKSKLAKVWEHFEELRAVVAEKGMLVPQHLVADLLGLSKQRVHVLVNEGRFEVVELQGHRYLTEQSVVDFAKDERKHGRPLKVVSNNRELARIALRNASTIVKRS